MKAITIAVDENLDAEAAAEARRRGISKSELYRNGVSALFPQHSPAHDADGPRATGDSTDLWETLAGFGPPGPSVAPGEIDDVIYGP